MSKFEELSLYKTNNNLISKKELSKIWKTTKSDFWISYFNLNFETYNLGKRKVYLFDKKEVDKVTLFLNHLENNSTSKQYAHQSFIMEHTLGYIHNSKNKKTVQKRIDKKEQSIEKMKQTNLKKYGTEIPSNSTKIKEKIKSSKIKKYGEEYGKYFSKKSKETILTRDGNYSCFGHNPKCSKCRYVWNNIMFDSKWEIYYYSYLKDNNIDFIYHPNPIIYNFNNKQYNYYPDFKVQDNYIEIKGDYLLKNMIEKTETKEHQKYKTMIKNNVKILTRKDIAFYKSEFEKTHNLSEIIDTRRNN